MGKPGWVLFMHLALARPRWRIEWQPRSTAKRLSCKSSEDKRAEGLHQRHYKLQQVKADIDYVGALGRALSAALAIGNVSSAHARLSARLLADIFSRQSPLGRK
ncbi:TPA: hypothetical protein ACH3X3_012985 [Trebouxia sp. C0006]